MGKNLNIIKEIVEKELGEAGDNLNRANMEFKNKNLNEKHGNSGRTRRDILASYQQRFNNIKNAKNWLDNLSE